MSISFTAYTDFTNPATSLGIALYTGVSTTDATPFCFGTFTLISIGQPTYPAIAFGEVEPVGFATVFAGPYVLSAMPAPVGYAGVFAAPIVVVAISGPPIAVGTAAALLSIPGSSDAAMVQPFGLASIDALPFVFSTFSPVGISIIPGPIVNPILLMQYSGFLQIFGEHLYEDLIDHGVLHDSITSQVILNIFDAAVASTALTSGMAGSVTFNDVGNATDTMLCTVYLALAASATATDNLGAALSLLLQASDLVQASDSLVSALQANVLVATIATASTKLDGYHIENLADTIIATDSLSSQAQLLVSLMDQAQATTSLTDSLQLTLLLSDAATAEDSLTTQLTAMNNILEIGVAYGSLHLTGQDYSFYAMSVEKAAVSSYTNFQGNSMAVIAGHAYGAFDDGIYLLEGADDAGTNIDARVRTGLDTLGVVLRKEAPNVYIGYTSTGGAVLKVITTDDGTKKENWYQLNPIPYESTTENRFRVSKGLHSVYWGYELASLDGSEMTLDFIKVWRLVLTRRKK